MDDRREARAEGGRRFQREWAITAKDLYMAMVVLVRGTKSSRLSMERRGRRDVMTVIDVSIVFAFKPNVLKCILSSCLLNPIP